MSERVLLFAPGDSIDSVIEPDAVECSVVVPSYKGSHRLPRLLKCFSGQQYEGSWELVVVLDGRDEASLRVLEAYEATLPLRVIIREHSGGVASAMRDGISAARGRIVIRSDDDLAPGPDFIATHMRHHHEGAAGVIGPTLDVFPPGRYAEIYGRPANLRALASAYARPEDERWIGWAANNSAPRAWIERVGSFDPGLWYGEDSELGYRLHQAGLPITVDKQLEIAHHGPATSVAARAPRAFVAGASRAAFRRRHPEATQQPQAAAAGSPAARAWNAAVATTSTILRSHASYARAGRLTDTAILLVPRPVGAKLVALLVEAAGKSGTRDGGHDMSKFRGQKSKELAQEAETTPGWVQEMNTNDPRAGISVVIPHYGDRQPTEALVTALQAQHDAPPLQVIVVDDCSPTPLEPIRGGELVRRASNGGYGSAINSGVALARHETLLILNSDLVIEPDFLRDLAEASAPLMPAVVSPLIVDEHGRSQWAARHFPTARHHFVAALGGLARFRHTNWWHEAVGHDTSATAGTTVEVDWVVGAVTLLPTAEFRQLHGFDEGFYMNSEEVDLQRRLRYRGVPSFHIGTVRATHESGGSSDPARRRAWMLSSAFRYAEKWKQSPGLHRGALALAALINFGSNSLRQLAGRDARAISTLRRELGYTTLPTHRVQ